MLPASEPKLIIAPCLGPKVNTVEKLSQLRDAGMNVGVFGLSIACEVLVETNVFDVTFVSAHELLAWYI